MRDLSKDCFEVVFPCGVDEGHLGLSEEIGVEVNLFVIDKSLVIDIFRFQCFYSYAIPCP